MTSTRKAIIYPGQRKFMEEAGHELGFFRSLEEIKALSSLSSFFKKRKDDNQKNQDEDDPARK